MDIEILSNDLDRSHRIGNLKTKKKERPIIIQLKNNIFKNKKLLNWKGVSIIESLTKNPMGKLNEARKAYGFRNVWTSDVKI